MTRLEIPPGEAGIHATVRELTRLARQYAVHPMVRNYAASLVRDAGQNREAQAARLRRWLELEVHFLPDPSVAEYVQAPDYLLERHQLGMTLHGDCDDVALLAAALAMSIGFRARYVLVGRDTYEHIFTEIAEDDGGEDWLELDSTREDQRIPLAYLNRATAVEI